jgi:hypothetical protein
VNHTVTCLSAWAQFGRRGMIITSGCLAPPIPTRGKILPILLLCASCGTTEPVDPLQDVFGAWSSVDATRSTTAVFREDGTALVVDADLGSQVCSSSPGVWDRAERWITFRDAGGAGSIEFELAEDGERLVSADLGRSLSRSFGASEPSCVSFGWGQWEGEVSALVDGTPVSFGPFDVQMSVSSGVMELRGLCDGCAMVAPELVLRIDASPGPLERGEFTVQNVPGATRTLFGFHHTHPGHPSFLGFNTDRLSPPGTLTLTDVTPERVAATFSFRGNPIVEGQAAPDGRVTVLVTDGVVNLRYR